MTSEERRWDITDFCSGLLRGRVGTFENLTQNVLSHADICLTQTETDLEGLDASHSLTGRGL